MSHRDHTRCHQGRSTTRGASHRPLRVPRVAGGIEVWKLRGRGEAPLGHRRRTQDGQAHGLHVFGHTSGATLAGTAGERLRSPREWEPRYRHHVLDEGRNSVEPSPPGTLRRCTAERHVVALESHRAKARTQHPSTVHAGSDHLAHRQVSPIQRIDGGHCVEAGQLIVKTVDDRPPRSGSACLDGFIFHGSVRGVGRGGI